MLQAALIVVAGWYVFSPAVHGDWLWDDHEIRDNPTLHEGLGGLGKIWVAPATTDYYPVDATVLWAEWHLWRDHVTGYHLTNIGLHLLGAFLLWVLLERIGVRFAWLGGLLFVVHPLTVESVAWISEIKNTLSLPLMLLALILWIDWDTIRWSESPPTRSFDAAKKMAPTILPNEARSGQHAPPFYSLSLLCFLAAMLSKSSVVMLPAVLLLYAWWQRGRIGGTDLRAAAPFFGIALLLGLVAIHFQSGRAMGDWRTPAGGILPRIGGAGLAIGFYFWKCVFPLEVMPIYPGWSMSTTSLVAFLPWLILGTAIFGLLYGRKKAQKKASDLWPGSLFGLGWFVLFLVPVLGFIPMAYQHFAPVGDQLVYLPLVGIIGLATAGFGTIFKVAQASTPAVSTTAGETPALLPLLGWIVVAAIVLALAVKSRSYAGIFVNQETMWTYNAEHNTRTSSVYSNLGFVLNRDGRIEAAVGSYEKAIQLDPEDAAAEDELAGVLAGQNRLSEAAPHYERAIALYQRELQRDPGLRSVNNKLGLDLTKVGRMAEAAGQFEQALRRNPDSYEAHTNLGLVLFRLGRLPEAISHYEVAARLDPGSAAIQTNLGYALVVAGRPAEAILPYEQALRLDPDYPGAHNNYGYALAQLGRFAEARSQFEAALQLRSDDEDARSNLARLPPPHPEP